MNVAAGPELAAAVTNAGGLGVIGGHGYTPKILRQQVRANAPTQGSVHSQALNFQIKAIKADLKDPNAPFGVDLLVPQVGGNARKTNVCHAFLPGMMALNLKWPTSMTIRRDNSTSSSTSLLRRKPLFSSVLSVFHLHTQSRNYTRRAYPS